MMFDIKDIKLAKKGKLRIEWAERNMPVLRLIKERFKKEKPLTGVTVGACLHVTAETANLVKTLKAGGAKVFLCASNPLSTQDEVAASLVKDESMAVFASRGEDSQTYYRHLQMVLNGRPNITMDDGADLVSEFHKFEIRNSKHETNSKFLPCRLPAGQAGQAGKIQNSKHQEWSFYGSSEETTTGVIRLRAMEKDGALKIPVVAVNDSLTKHFFDNRYGTGQSTVDGILRATNLLLAGKQVVVVGYGWCGRGLGMRMRGMGAQVIVCEIDSVKALEAVMDGFMVMPLLTACRVADIIVTLTGDKHVLDKKHFVVMKDFVILANSGHFNVEINLEALEKMAVAKRRVREFVEEYQIKIKNQKSKIKNIYVLGEGRLINLVAAEGHPAEVMDMSFSNQALSAEWLVKNYGRLKPKVYRLPEKLDKMVAELKLKAMGVKIDRLTKEQKQYLQSWQEGT